VEECIACKELYTGHHDCCVSLFKQLREQVPPEVLYEHLLKLKNKVPARRNLLYYPLWDTNIMLEVDIHSRDVSQKEVFFDCPIPRFSKLIIAKNPPRKAGCQSSSSFKQSSAFSDQGDRGPQMVQNYSDSSKLFLVGGAVKDKTVNMKAVNWLLEYVRESCFF